MPSTVVLANDRPEGEAALHWAAEHARRCGTELQAVLVRADSPAAPEYGSRPLRERVVTRLVEAGVPHLVLDPEQDVVAQVDRLAAELGADVVVPVRRRSPTMKLVMGSIAQQVVLDAPCPVVAVKGLR